MIRDLKPFTHLQEPEIRQLDVSERQKEIFKGE